MARQTSAPMHQSRRASLSAIGKHDSLKGYTGQQRRPVRQQSSVYQTAFTRSHIGELVKHQGVSANVKYGGAQRQEQSNDSQLMVTSARIVSAISI